ncbi:MAG: hypothetical protein P8Z35_21130, partial [Ignavibacteriaceae bacterium]
SGVLGWIFTQKIEKSDSITDTVHLLKEAELQLRREEKNLLIRGYSQQRYLRWQKAKENFHQKFGELIGLKALTVTEINALKKDYTEMSDTYNKFFDEIRSNALIQDDIIKYDTQFKNIGRKTLEMINSILSREQVVSDKTDSQADILIAVFLIVFIATASFLIVNVLKYL